MEVGVSVIICCYNSALRIKDTLYHLAKQRVYSKTSWEIILVNNASLDNTFAAATNFWREIGSNIEFNVIDEFKPGLIYAKLTGILNARYDIIIFCDDDNWLDTSYVEYAFQLFKNKSNIGIAGGKAYGAFEITPPFWFNHFESAYAIGPQLGKTGIANERKYVFGAAMVVRKEIFLKLQNKSFQSVLTGRLGKALSSGEDSELCLLALYLGYDLYYDERLVFTHYITKERLNWAYCVKMVSKGFALPQFQFYLYDYCFKAIMANQQPSFGYTYKRNIRKPAQAIVQNLKGFQSFLTTIKLLLFSKPGSRKEIEIKTNFNKLFYVLTNKRKLRADFNTICVLMHKIKREKQIA